VAKHGRAHTAVAMLPVERLRQDSCKLLTLTECTCIGTLCMFKYIFLAKEEHNSLVIL